MEGGGGGQISTADPPIRASEQTVWADVSSLIGAACEDLQDGELIHGENFSLFAAMSALEIMDPKMDSGMQCSGYHSIEEAIENGAAPIPLSTDPNVDVQRTIDFMDHLLACEATWHRGHLLAQTVYSCIYLLQIERTSSHALLHSYCRIIRATCNSVISVVSSARTHEEEDIFTATYGLPLKGDGDEKFLSIINSVEEAISRQLRACKASSSKKKLNEGLESLHENVDLKEGYCKSLLARLRFRKYFYHVLLSIGKPQGKGLELAHKHIISCLSELKHVRESSDFLTSNAHGSRQNDHKTGTTASGCHPVGFDVSLNSRLSAPAPPRAIKILSWTEAIDYFEKLLRDLDFICSFSMDPLVEDILRFILQFQKRKPDLVARAYLQRLLVHDGKMYGQESFGDVIFRTLASLDVTRNEELLKRFRKNEFVMQLGQLLINLIKVLCTNTAWKRRKLGKILQDWSFISVQLELTFRKDFEEITDDFVNEDPYLRLSKHLVIWVQEQTYWIASRFLMLGFQLELYCPYEYCMVYWYMYVIFVKHMETAQLRKVGDSNICRRKGKKKRDPSKNVVRNTGFPPAALLLQCYICLSQGLAMMMAALANEKKEFQMPCAFNSEEERFSQHFELLQKAHVPDHISYFLFKESTVNVRISTVMKYDYFRDAQQISLLLRDSFSDDPDKLAELRQIELVAEYNRIALNVINQAGSHDMSLKISFEFSHHPCFAVAVVKRL